MRSISRRKSRSRSCESAPRLLSTFATWRESMLRDVPIVSLGRQWRIIQAKLPEDWAHARLGLTPTNPQRLDRAAALLGPLTPGRAGGNAQIRGWARRARELAAAVTRALRRLDLERIRGKLELVALRRGRSDRPPARRAGPGGGAARRVLGRPGREPARRLERPLRAARPDLQRPPDPAALALAPVNPLRYGPANGFRFRVARSFGYGASPGMTRRCLARLDERGIAGTLTVLRVLSDSNPVGTEDRSGTSAARPSDPPPGPRGFDQRGCGKVSCVSAVQTKRGLVGNAKEIVGRAKSVARLQAQLAQLEIKQKLVKIGSAPVSPSSRSS